MRPPLVRFVVRRIVRAMVLVVAVSSAALLLVHLAPGDAYSSFDVDPAFAAAERARLGLDRPFAEQYSAWLGRMLVLDLGESARFRRPVADLIRERLFNTLLLGSAALVFAIGLGIPAGVMTGSAPGSWTARLISVVSIVLLATPPLVTALVLLMLAARTGWLPAGGLAPGIGTGAFGAVGAWFRYLPLPALALALPIAASLERLESRAMAAALREPSIAAARARGISASRSTWRHAFRLSLTSVLGVLGIVIGTVLSGSFVVEIVMSWPGLGGLMYDALVARDLYLAAGCAASGAVFLATGILAADIALMTADPRVVDSV